MEIFFETETLTEEQIKEGLIKGVASRGLFPLLCVSAKQNMGVDRLMEFITLVAPKVTDVPAPVNSKGQEIKPLSKRPCVSIRFQVLDGRAYRRDKLLQGNVR
jgi:elongation factor G